MTQNFAFLIYQFSLLINLLFKDSLHLNQIVLVILFRQLSIILKTLF